MNLEKMFTDFLKNNEIPLNDEAKDLLDALEEADENLLFLCHLEGAGVDNWEGYDYARESFAEAMGE